MSYICFTCNNVSNSIAFLVRDCPLVLAIFERLKSIQLNVQFYLEPVIEIAFMFNGESV